MSRVLLLIIYLNLISCSVGKIEGIRIDSKGDYYNISEKSLKDYFINSKDEFIEYNYKLKKELKYRFNPSYQYEISIYNFGYTNKIIDINLDEHCPPALNRFIIIRRDFFNLLLSFLSIHLYNNTNFLLLCQEKI